MQDKFDLVVYIGRFQPFHKGHWKTICRAFDFSPKVLVLVGSSNAARSTKNPWTYDERKTMIEHAFTPDKHGDRGVVCAPLPDFMYNDSEWIAKVGETVNHHKNFPNDRVAIIGHDKDSSSFYLNYFPQWSFIDMPAFPENGATIDSTKIRRLLFNGDHEFVRSVVPKSVMGDILVTAKTADFKTLQEDWHYIEDYKRTWENSPFPPTFVTVDSVVIQSGHILLIQRGHSPGKNLWALPGGFLKIDKSVKDSAIEELREETKIKVPEKVLRGSIIDSEVFDDPDRSTRGRTVTHVFLFKLNDAEHLPKVKGSDDAVDAKWFPLSDFENMSTDMFEDHWFIANHMLREI